mgnify:FL=1
MRHFTQCFDANHSIIRLRLSGKVMQFVMRLQFNAEGVILFIVQGWRQPTLGYACSSTPFFMTSGSEQNA